MIMPNIHAGRLERRVRRVGRATMPGIHGFCSFYPFGAIRGKPLLRPALNRLINAGPDFKLTHWNSGFISRHKCNR